MGSMDITPKHTDHIAIAGTCTAMGWWADRRQWDQLETLFFEEVLVDYTSLNGGHPGRVSRGDLVAGWRDTLDPLAGRISELTMTAVWETGSREVMGAGEGSR
jgi:SnoaL-like domain